MDTSALPLAGPASTGLPPGFTERLEKLLSPEQYRVALEGMKERRRTTFRVNTLRTSVTNALSELSDLGFEVTPISWLPGAFQLANRTQRELTDSEIYTTGQIYVQGVSSMIPPVVLDPQPGETILDLAAAPGSKTTQMAALMNNQGSIVANDTSPIRLFKLQANLQIQGVQNTRTRRGPGESLWQKYPETFDRALVDVPCSMEGRFCLTDPESLEDWSYRKVRDLSIRQSHLLRAAVTATKVGGCIVYSTCTMSPEENEHVVHWLLQREAGKVVLEDITPDELRHAPETMPGVTSWERETFTPEMTKTLRILPSPLMEGFYVAKLRKIASTLPTQESLGQRSGFRHQHQRQQQRRLPGGTSLFRSRGRK
jgi:16S rRNA (cytosine1407-C5)-methyltransferase